VPESTSEFVTAAVAVTPATRFFLNADGLGPDAALRIELLDERERPVVGYSGPDAAVVRQSGSQTPITWPATPSATPLPEHTRLRVVFAGRKNTAIRFSALYVRP
jgi:hypothetical protein